MCHLTSCKNSVTLSFLNWVKIEMYLSYFLINVGNVALKSLPRWLERYVFVDHGFPGINICTYMYIWATQCETASPGICGERGPDHVLHCQLTESLDTTECIHGDPDHSLRMRS